MFHQKFTTKSTFDPLHPVYTIKNTLSLSNVIKLTSENTNILKSSINKLTPHSDTYSLSIMLQFVTCIVNGYILYDVFANDEKLFAVMHSL